MRLAKSLLGLMLSASFLGCGSSDGTSEPAAQTASPSSGPAVLHADVSQPSPGGVHGPGEIVASFYDALRAGDNEGIAALLTDRAREETARSGLGIQSQASETLSYEIGETEYVTDDGAHVMSLWEESDPAGELVATQVVWVLRKQPLGWRISGMATPVMEGQPPVLFNFEDPEDMLEKKALIESQMAEAGVAEPAASEPSAAAASGEPTITSASPAGEYPQVAAPLGELPADATRR